MPDERDDAEKAQEALGVKPAEGATAQDPTGADAVAARPTDTITGGGTVTREENPEQFDAESYPHRRAFP